jgi:hypothetical protein
MRGNRPLGLPGSRRSTQQRVHGNCRGQRRVSGEGEGPDDDDGSGAHQASPYRGGSGRGTPAWPGADRALGAHQDHLVGSGLSNTEIATLLTISEATVKTHVGHIMAKLGLRDRIQTVVYAYETGLITPPGRQNRAAGP